jgi:predicted nucleic acid-binding protein
MVVIDDKEGRALAAAMGVEHMGTAGILLEAYASGRLRIDELEDALRELSGVLWLSPAVVVEILRRARGMRK